MRSKIVLLGVVTIVLVFGAVVLGYFVALRASRYQEVAGVNTQKMTPVSPAVSSQAAALKVSQSSQSGQISESEQLVNSFYRWYINCLSQFGICDYKDRLEVDYGQLMEKTRAVTTYDRLLCAQNIPKLFRIDHSTKDADDLESVYLVESFESDQVQLIVEVQKTASLPKIVNVICPRP